MNIENIINITELITFFIIAIPSIMLVCFFVLCYRVKKIMIYLNSIDTNLVDLANILIGKEKTIVQDNETEIEKEYNEILQKILK